MPAAVNACSTRGVAAVTALTLTGHVALDSPVASADAHSSNAPAREGDASSGAVAGSGGIEEDDAALDIIDAHLPVAARRTRMHVCMEHVQQHAKEHANQVRLYVQQISDRLSERDAKNYLFHNLLVNCYFRIRQEEVDSFGDDELPVGRRTQLLARPSNRPRLRFSARQTEVLDSILRESGVMGPEVELLGFRLSSLPTQWRIILAASSLILCAVLLACLAAALFRRRSGSSSGGCDAAHASSARERRRGQERLFCGEQKKGRDAADAPQLPAAAASKKGSAGNSGPAKAGQPGLRRRY